jgi:hypothetical protein
MSFNGGGANVGGVQALEQGNLTIQTIPTTFSAVGGELQEIDFTVPAGKRWILKGFVSTSSSFVGTQGSQTPRIRIGSTNINLASTTTAYVVWYAGQVYTLTSGQIFRFSSNTTAWTSGQINCTLLYQEVSI